MEINQEADTDEEEHLNDVNSCNEAYPDAEHLELCCYICKEEGECLWGLFKPEELDNPRQELSDVSTKAIRMYLELLYSNRDPIRYAERLFEGNNIRTRLELMNKRIGILEKIVAERQPVQLELFS